MGCFLLLLLVFPTMLFHLPILVLSSSSSSPQHSFFLCHPDQSSALLQFKNTFQLVGSSYPRCGNKPILRTASWENGTDCCSWEGVTCDSISGHVIGLDLTCDGHVGYLHPNSTLFRLTHLQRLNLAFNYFDWSQLPSQIGGFVSLTHLNLSSSNFGGDLPSQISHLSKLVSLDLSSNYELKWRGTTWKRLLQNATGLRKILLDGTNMSSISPSPLSSLPKWSSSSSLVALSLADTGIEGDLTTDILCLPNLQHLSLGGWGNIQVHLPDQLNCSSASLITVLDLSGCSFQAGSIPSSFANLTHLSSLFLSYNNLNASIPQFLSNLSHLTHLDLSRNALNGPIPSSSLSNLQHLTFLDLSNNQLSGQVPDVFNELPKLQTLSLNKNNLGGQLPSSLFALTQLSSLDYSSNKFEGPLPSNITGFTNLTHLHLSDNKLNESLPSWCLSVPSLTSLDLTNNQFSGHIGAISSSYLEDLHLCGNKLQGNIPESIFNLANLTFLCLSSNDSTSPVHFSLFSKFQYLNILTLSGYSSLSLKSEINNVSYSFPRLEVLHLLSNNLTNYAEASLKFPELSTLEISNSSLQGEVPKWIRDIDGLRELLLSHNLLTPIHPLPRSIRSIDLSSNLMTGDISSLICNATSLDMINLSHNKFTGTFPQCIANFSDLSTLDLQMNNLHGPLPNTFSMNTNLQTLNLNGNQFEGSLPESLSNCTYLEDLNLGNNQLEDSFPHWTQNLQGLQILVLRANKLYGPLVSMAVKKDPSFFNLIFFDVSCNNFSGPLPEDYIKSFQDMKYSLHAASETIVDYMEKGFGISSEYYNDYIIEYANSLVATMKGVSTPYGKIPIVLVNIDLSVNNFEGEIPNVIGELQGLIGLNLSHNRLTGPIPHSMGNLTNLESLDLSSNMFTGDIPIELANLNFLEAINLSQNQLVGPIPKGKQFDTFSNESYEGNTGLCGFPLTKLCNNSDLESPSSPPASEMEEKFGFGWKPVAIGYGCGMVFGIGLGWLVLFIGKPLWLVSMFGGSSGPNKRVKRRKSRGTRTHHGSHTRVN